jgi:hypothetical protein
MNLIRLQRHQHPRPTYHELRQKRVLDSGYRSIGQVANLYVDNDMELYFVDVATGGLMGLATKHHLVPVEAIVSEDAGSITLTLDQQAVESAPAYANPHAGLDEELQRATREHYLHSKGAVPSKTARTSENAQQANFAERRHGEVRRTSLLRN